MGSKFGSNRIHWTVLSQLVTGSEYGHTMYPIKTYAI